MKFLFLRLFSRISRFLIESNFKSCKEISLKFRWFFFVKMQHFSTETGRLEKIQQFQMQFPQLGKPREGWIFFQWKYMTRAFRNVMSHRRCGPLCPVRAFLKHPNIQLKNCKVALISPYHHFSPLGKIFHFMRIFL
jgi:hypothetical protein